MKQAKAAFLWLGLALLLAAGCGYSLSTSPYGLMEAMNISVPVAKNQSRFGELGPKLTADVIDRLDASTNITVRETAPASLNLTINGVTVSGGAWETGRYESDNPTRSASRVVTVVVSATFQRPNPDGGQPLTTTRNFGSSRTFFVNENQAETELRQNEAFDWLIGDLGQKIAQNMFSEF